MRLLGLLAAAAAAWRYAVEATPNGPTSTSNLVTWDKYSLSINGTRVFINSAEFHYQRLPIPDLWPDIFQKLKANGFNTVSIYLFWSFHSPAKGVLDFVSPGKNIQQLFDAAKAAGLWVITRAGPYCNAETNAGGLALWGSDGSLGKLRTSDEAYHQAWRPWILGVGKIIAKNQITNGGPVIMNQIENELQETTHSATDTLVIYMQQIEAAFKEAGIVVPSTSNEKGMRSQSWSTDYQNVGGAVDLYGLDSYPGSLSCTNPNSGFQVPRTYHQWFSNYSFTQPSFLPEFEAGWFSAWGSDTFYDQCTSEHDPAFADVYYKNNIGQRVTMQNLYMVFGGTSWGHSAAPVVYTSYDYSAPLRETRQQWNKLFQTKLVNMFSGTSPDLLKTVMVGNGNGFHVSLSTVFSWVLRNPDTGATFTVVQQSSSPSTANVTFSATLNTSAGTVTVPGVTLHGRQSKILVTDYRFGGTNKQQQHTLLYSSADVLTSAGFDDGNGDDDVLVLYLKEGQTGEFAFKEGSDTSAAPATAAAGGLTYTVSGSSTVMATGGGSSGGNGGRQTFTYTQKAGSTAVRLSNGVLVYLLDQPTAWRFWAPAIDGEGGQQQQQQQQQQKRVFVIGPYLVRNATVHGTELHISGDSDVATPLEAYVGGASIQTVVWNGIRLPATRTAYGSYTVTVPGAADRVVTLPSLADQQWYVADALPEAQPGYDDSGWTTCNKTTTRSPVPPVSLPVLFGSDYGHYVGAKVYRGYFDGRPTSVNITASGGLAFGWSAWLNGRHIGGHSGGKTQATTSAVLALPAAAVQESGNVLTVLVDYHGHDETSTRNGMHNPRGLLGAVLSQPSTPFRQWKLAVPQPQLDPVRGPMNEGGLRPERAGWHLPGFRPESHPSFFSSSSSSSPLTTGLTGPGARFYLATFNLSVDADLDVPLGVELAAPEGTVARVMLWINGWQYGKFVPHIGPQTRFPIPPGVVNNRGRNTIAVSLWAQGDAGARLSTLRLFTYGKYHTSFPFARDWPALGVQPPWKERAGVV